MKALYIRSVYFLGFKSGGSVTHTAGVINALKDKIDLSVFSNDELAEVKHPIEIIDPILTKIPVFNELLYNFKMLRSLPKERFDFVYQRFSGESFCGAKYAKKNNIPFVLEFNSSEVWKLQNWSKTGSILKNLLKKYVQLPITRWIEQYNLQQANVIVVVSEALRENLLKAGIPNEKILVNPNGVEIDRFKVSPKSPRIVDRYHLHDKFVVGFIGTFGKWHGVLELAEAAVKFYRKYPEYKEKVRFLIMGNGKLFDEVQAIIGESQCQNNIILTGAIPQNMGPLYLKACDVFLSPHIPNPDGTKFFGSPTKLFEYMACKKAIIASNLDQIGEILTHEKTAHLVEPGNIDNLVEAIAFVYRNPDYATSIAEAAYNLVGTKYTWDVHVDKILNAIQKSNYGNLS